MLPVLFFCLILSFRLINSKGGSVLPHLGIYSCTNIYSSKSSDVNFSPFYPIDFRLISFWVFIHLLSKCNDVKQDILGKLPNDIIYHIDWISFVAHVLICKFMS